MKRLLSEFIFWISGWKVVGEREFPDKCLVIAAPHTSNWDFAIGRCFAYIIGIVPKYLIKGELFFPIFGTLIKWNGGIPVYRHSKNNVVDQISELYNSKNQVYELSSENKFFSSEELIKGSLLVLIFSIFIFK